jgi:hypothetical protein
MSLNNAIQTLLSTRNIHAADAAISMGDRNRATFYRMLNGSTGDPRISTLVEACRVLRTTPSHMLELAGLWETPPSEDELDRRLQRAITRLQNLPRERKELAISQVEVLLSIWEKQAMRRLAS